MLKLISCSVNLNRPILNYIKLLQIPEECLPHIPVVPIIKNGRAICRYAHMTTHRGACIGVVADTEAQELKPVLLRYEIGREKWQMLIFCPGGVVCLIQSSYIKDLFYALFYECIYDRCIANQEGDEKLGSILERVNRTEKRYIPADILDTVIESQDVDEAAKDSIDSTEDSDMILPPGLGELTDPLTKNKHISIADMIGEPNT